MNGLVAIIRCGKRPVNKYKVVLAENTRLYPVSQELVEIIEEGAAAIELGFDESEVISSNECLLRYRQLDEDRRAVICQQGVLQIPVLGLVCYEWLEMAGNTALFYKKYGRTCEEVGEALFTIRKSFTHPHLVSPVMLSRNRQKIINCLTNKKVANDIGEMEGWLLDVFVGLADIGLIRGKANSRRANQIALNIAHTMELVISNHTVYWGMNKQIVRKAVVQDQVRRALAVVDMRKAWTTIVR